MTDPMPMDEFTKHLESIGFAETLAAGRRRIKKKSLWSEFISRIMKMRNRK